MNPEGNNVLVEMLGSALRHGGTALNDVPALLKRVLTEESWRVFRTRQGQLIEYDGRPGHRFTDFVSNPPLAGLGADVELVRRVIADDAKALTALDDALKGKPGRPKKTSNNIRGFQRKQGTSADQALRRLQHDRPDLHAKVLAKELSAHAAMIQAGFRPRTITVRTDQPDRIAATLRRQLDPETLSAVARLLQATPERTQP